MCIQHICSKNSCFLSDYANFEFFAFKEGVKYELELTDGWYAVRTTIDPPLTLLIQNLRIRIGVKLMIQNAELLNCEGCHPLEVPDFVRLKINFNNIRKAPWDIKLGYQKQPRPFVIPLSHVHPNGGMISCLKLTITRVYPLQYMEQQDDSRGITLNIFFL